MVAATFDKALARLLAHEGGYSNHPSDPGGPTKFGITIGDYRRYVRPDATADDVRAMSLDVAKTIYRDRYWRALRCDALPAGVDDCVFDYGVNSGTARAGKVLRAVLGLSSATAIVSEEVIEAARKRDPKALIAAICDERMRFLKSLRTWPVFGRGWERRVNEVRNFDLQLAATADATVPAPRDANAEPTGRGQVTPPKIGPKTGTAGSAASAGTLWAAWEWVQGHPLETAAIVAAAAVAVTLGMNVLRRQADRAQLTPMDGTPIVPEAATPGVRP